LIGGRPTGRRLAVREGERIIGTGKFAVNGEPGHGSMESRYDDAVERFLKHESDNMLDIR
jgi:hypothetical protein